MVVACQILLVLLQGGRPPACRCRCRSSNSQDMSCHGGAFCQLITSACAAPSYRLWRGGGRRGCQGRAQPLQQTSGGGNGGPLRCHSYQNDNRWSALVAWERWGRWKEPVTRRASSSMSISFDSGVCMLGLLLLCCWPSEWPVTRVSSLALVV